MGVLHNNLANVLDLRFVSPNIVQFNSMLDYTCMDWPTSSRLLFHSANQSCQWVVVPRIARAINASILGLHNSPSDKLGLFPRECDVLFHLFSSPFHEFHWRIIVLFLDNQERKTASYFLITGPVFPPRNIGVHSVSTWCARVYMINHLSLSLRLEQVQITRRDGLAKVLGTIASVGGATIMTTYKGPPLVHPDQQSIGSSKMNDDMLKMQNWTLGCIYLLGHCLSWAGWMVFQNYGCKSHCGGLVGLYMVLWGKNEETRVANQDKEETLTKHILDADSKIEGFAAVTDVS
ncbi:hypothetical protein RJ639_011695 [Escallonia herrerae]|uniref:WAT1-related protein n=1 Tax=Escallonia herrerae TaxID=1293975 RepID=A0AA88VNY4_9ASTE|nr:hypothetical protein RJ639_011695 [Escallonia herrerae]